MCQPRQPIRARGLGGMILPWAALAFCLLTPAPQALPQNPSQPEIQAHEGKAEDTKPFQIHVERNLVTVKVVVRDKDGRAVGHLPQENFRLLDEGKPQEILGFTEEASVPGAPEPMPTAPSAPTANAPAAPPAPPKTFAQRFVILYFDDFHLEAGGMGRTRDAAWRYVLTAVQPQDRVAIFTASSKDQLDFTDNRDKIHDALFKLAARPQSPRGACPAMSDFEAYQVTQQVPDALAIVHVEAIQCDCQSPGTDSPGNPHDPMTERSALLLTGPANSCDAVAEQRVEREAHQIWDFANLTSKYSLDGIEAAVRRLAAMPGQRTLVLVSPGFLTQTAEDRIDDITNRALQQDVVISAVDAVGLGTRTQRGGLATRPDLESRKTMIDNVETLSSEDVLFGLSAATGGTFFHNDNDFFVGFQQAAAAPEAYYVLTFSPADLKLDGKFHSLKVTLNGHDGFTVQARRGYFASETAFSGNISGQDSLEKMVFSQEEVHNLSAEVSAQAAPGGDKLTVTIHVDVRQLQFRKDADRSSDKLIFHTTIFDGDGKYIAAKEASLDLHLKDETLQKLMPSGLNAKTSFEVPAGAYRVREIVRDTESKGVAALNCVVQVPGKPATDVAH